MDNLLEEFLRSHWGLGLALFWGALWGSFANVCIYRIPRRESLAFPPSHCTQCQKPIAFYDNIPLLSWLILRGSCRSCGARISPRYPIIELCAAGLSALLYARFVSHLGFSSALFEPTGVALSRYIVYFFFVIVLLVLSAIDIEHQILPDRITYPAIPAFFLLGRFLYWRFGGVTHGQAIAGLVCGYLVVRLIADGYYYLSGREGLGYGDGKLLSLIGGLLGFRSLPLTLFLASILGLCLAIPFTLWQRRRRPTDTPLRHTSVVFGPFLACGAIVYLIFLLGRDIDTLLLRTLGPLLDETV